MARPATAAVRLLTGEREPVRLATTANISLSGLQTIDGVLTEVGDRVLVKSQTNAAENGIYTASAGAWYRASDARTARTMQKGTTVHVQQGTIASSYVYSFQTFEPEIGTDAIVLAFVQSDDTIGAVNAAVSAGLSAVQSAGAAGVSAVEAAGATEVQEVNDAGAAIVAAAEAARDAAQAAGANEFAATRAALKALNTDAFTHVYLTEPGRDGQFVFRTGDYSAQITADTKEALYIKADGVAASAGAWVRQGGWATDGVDVRWFGVVIDSTGAAATNSLAIQAAIDLASALSIPTNLPAGLIWLALNQTSPQLGHSAAACALKPRSNMTLRGCGMGKTTLKLLDNQSTDAAPLVAYSMIIGNGIYTNVTLEDYTADMNGQNNKVSPNRSRFYSTTAFNATPGILRATVPHGMSVGDQVRVWRTSPSQVLMPPLVEGTIYYVSAVPNSTDVNVALTLGGASIALTGGGSNPVTMERVGTFNAVHAAAMIISGTTTVVGDARLIKSKITRVEVINGAGYNSFVLGHAGNTVISPKCDDVEVSHCRFYNNGLDVDDYSAIFAHGDHMNVHDCVFDHPTQSTGIMGPAVAMEMHGNNNRFVNNYVNNYMQGLWICGTFNGPVRDCKVIGNTIKINAWGIATWTIPPLNHDLFDIIISDNTIEVRGDPKWDNPGGARAGIALVNTSSNQGRIMVANNTIRCLATRMNHGIMVASEGVSPATMQNIDIIGNNIGGFASGIIVTDGGRPVYNCNIIGNDIHSITASVLQTSSGTRGITVAGTHGTIHIAGNGIIAGAALNTGIHASGYMDNFHMADNRITGATADINDTVVVSGTRSGREGLTFPGVPSTSTWVIGDQAYKRVPNHAGTAPNKYIVNGWTRLTAGTANVLNTDWVENRTLSGL